MVRLAHFHFARRNIPHARVQIELFPFGMAKLARTDKHVWGELQRQLG
jgi:hypothetical protein